MVISTVNQVVYNGDGVTAAWPYTFQTIDKSDVKVMLIYENGTRVEIDSDYYVDAVNNTVYYPGYAPGAEPPEADQPPKVQEGQKLMLYRQLPLTQEADLGDFWPFSVIEKGLDKLTMLVQDVYGWYNRNVMTYKQGELAWNADNYRIADVENPINQQDAATKQYVDDIVAGIVAAGNDVIVVDNVAAMKAADLEDGMFCATGGYYNVGDGGNGLYRIRAKQVVDIDDGGSIIFLDDNVNVAELIYNGTVVVEQFGAYGDNTHDDTIAVQNAVMMSGIVRFTAGKTYLISSNYSRNIYVPANTTIDINSATLNFNGYGFVNCKKTVPDYVYSGNGNITIKNGTINNGEILLAHSKDTVFSNLHFKNRTGHYMQIMSCYNVLITHCTFYGMGDGANHVDAINLDPCVVSAFHVYGDGSAAYDGTNNSHITIEHCESRQGTDAGYTKGISLGVSHYHASDSMWHEYVTIQNCTIELNDSTTTGLILYDLRYSKICHNTFIGKSTPMTTKYGVGNTISDNFRVSDTSFSSPRTITLTSDSKETDISVFDNGDTVADYIPMGITDSGTYNVSIKKCSPLRLTGNIEVAKNTDITLAAPVTLFNRLRLNVGSAGSGTFEVDFIFGAFSTTQFSLGGEYSCVNGGAKITVDANDPKIIQCNSDLKVRKVYGWVEPYV